jgi:hypothetical protein
MTVPVYDGDQSELRSDAQGGAFLSKIDAATVRERLPDAPAAFSSFVVTPLAS